MKRILTIVSVVAIVAGSFTSCKKGENDPGLSLKSRKGRLAGMWEISAGMFTETSSVGGTTTTIDYEYQDGQLITTQGGVINKFTHENTMEFTKEGTYKTHTSNTWVESAGIAITTAIKTDEDIEGNWAFAGKSKAAEQKKKETVLLFETKHTNSALTSSTDNYTGWTASDAIVLDKLSSKEIIIIIDDTYTDDDGDTWTNTGTITYTAK